MQAQDQILRFSPGDFEILRAVGEMGFATITDWEYYTPRNPLDPNQPSRTIQKNSLSVRLFEGKISSGSLRNSRVLLKEFFPSARSIAEQELRVYTDLVESLPEGGDLAETPVAILRGWFFTTDECETASFQRSWMQRFPRTQPPSAGNLWLVFRWEGNRAMSDLPRLSKKKETFWDKLNQPVFGRRDAKETKFAYLKRLMKESVSALVFLHERGIVHRSLGSSSISLSTIEFTEVNQLQVNIRDFGFAARVAKMDDETLQKAREAGANTPKEIVEFVTSQDIYAMAYALVETVFSVLATPREDADVQVSPIMKSWLSNAEVSQPGQTPRSSNSESPEDQNSLKRLIEDVFGGDIGGGFREYCSAEERWKDVVEFLDQEEGAGWQLLDSMLNCQRRSKQRKGIADMTEEEVSRIEVPSSFPTQAPLPAVPSARSLLSSPLFSAEPSNWWE